MGRVTLDQVSKQVGQPIVFENRGGAGGTLGANIVAKAAPDGHTILTSGSLASAHALHPTLPGVHHKAEIEKWWPIIEAANITVE